MVASRANRRSARRCVPSRSFWSSRASEVPGDEAVRDASLPVAEGLLHLPRLRARAVTERRHLVRAFRCAAHHGRQAGQRRGRPPLQVEEDRVLQEVGQGGAVHDRGNDEPPQVEGSQDLGRDPARSGRRFRPEQDDEPAALDAGVQLVSQEGAHADVRLVEPGVKAVLYEDLLDARGQTTVRRAVADEDHRRARGHGGGAATRRHAVR